MRSMLRWAALMGVGLLITGCAAQPLAPQVEEVVITQTPGSAETPAPQAGPITLYYPEGASQGDAAYAVTYDLPVFSGTGAGCFRHECSHPGMAGRAFGPGGIRTAPPG